MRDVTPFAEKELNQTEGVLLKCGFMDSYSAGFLPGTENRVAWVGGCCSLLGACYLAWVGFGWMNDVVGKEGIRLKCCSEVCASGHCWLCMWRMAMNTWIGILLVG
jgi:hypothetical protein